MKPLAAAAALFVAAFAVGAALIHQDDRIWAASQRESASHTAAGAAFALEQQISRSLSATYALAALVHHDPDIEDFERVGAQIVPLHGAISSIQLAPGAVVRRIFPLAGNEAALGHDLLADPARQADARAAIASRRLTVAGPFELRQGGLGLAGRLAVFLPDPRSGERFWGLVIALVRVPELLEAAQLRRIVQDGYRYRLTRDDGGRAPTCFAGCDDDLRDPVAFDVQVPNGAWTLAVAPAGGWPPPPARALRWLLAVAVAALLAGLALLVLRQPERLRREVAARTADLDRANAALAAEMARLRAAEEATRVAEEKLRQAQKLEAVGQLAGGIAHDFNNLLTGILGHASVLAEESAPGTATREAAETIEAAARRASDLTRQLLGFARRRPLQAAPFDAHQVLDDVTRLLARTLDAKIRVSTALAAPRAVVIGDAGQLQQAILNLAVNARDAMPDGGELRISTALLEHDDAWAAQRTGTAAGPYLAISVADTGHGIAPELRERIFEPFFTTKETGRGTGLGLAMVYGIARAHGGAVDVESAPGKGARFTLQLPLAPEGTAGVAAAARPPAARPGTGRIVVIDDDPVPRAATSALLRSSGYEVVEASSASEGLGWLSTHPGAARAVVLDVAMPGMDGVACLEALRRLDPGVKVVFVSGYAANGRAQELAARGEVGFLAKPFDRAQLTAAIETDARPNAP